MYNKITLIGNLTKDIEIKTSTNGNEYIFNTIAVNRDYKNAYQEKITDFIDFRVFGNLTKVFSYVNKGDKVLVEGTLNVDTVTSSDGKKKTSIYVNVNKLVLLTNKPKETENVKEETNYGNENTELPF